MGAGAGATAGAWRATVRAVLVGAALAGTAAPAGSQDRPAPDPDPDARAIYITVTAAEVADWARDNADAEAMIVAARMLADAGARRGSGDAPFLTPLVLLEEAATLAGGDAALMDRIEQLRTPVKGVRASPFGPGPIVMVRRLRARETYGFDVQARRGEVLRVAAIGDGDTNIDLVLRDQNGEVLCSDSSRDHYPVCTLARPTAGTIRVEIVNRGAVWSRVQILTN